MSNENFKVDAVVKAVAEIDKVITEESQAWLLRVGNGVNVR